MTSVSSTVAEHSSHHPNMEGLSPAGNGPRRERKLQRSKISIGHFGQCSIQVNA